MIAPLDNIGTCLKSHFSWVVNFIKPEIRLVDGRNSKEGRVELFYEGLYGTVCDDHFDDTDAGVACRMLGYKTGIALYSRDSGHSPAADFRSGTGQILLDEVECKGSEHHFTDCPYDKHTADCTHMEDAGVRCT